MTKKTAIKKKVVKKPVARRPVLQFRVHEHAYEALKESAAKNRLTISEEAADRLARSFREDDYLQAEIRAREDLETHLEKVMVENYELHQQQVLVTRFLEGQGRIEQKLDALLAARHEDRA